MAFWAGATATRPGAPQGDHGEFVPLAGDGEDPVLWVQRTGSGPPGWHPDLEVDDRDAAVTAATARGATVVSATPGFTSLRTPGGASFCLYDGERPHRRSSARGRPGGTRSLLDQVCLDLAPAAYDADVTMWREVTDWTPDDGDGDEFALLHDASDVPLRLLLQRLDEGDTSSAHLDFACSDRDREAQRHETLGAVVVSRDEHWTVMRDPVGLTYCLTVRDPSMSDPFA